TISGLMITGGAVSGPGAGILAGDEVLTIADSTIANNTANSGNAGGGVCVGDGSKLVVTNSTFANNKATGAGGAIAATGKATVTLTGSTLSGNTAGLLAGGLALLNTAGVTITDSSVSSNSGTGITFYAGGTLVMTGSTVANNSAPNGT